MRLGLRARARVRVRVGVGPNPNLHDREVVGRVAEDAIESGEDLARRGHLVKVRVRVRVRVRT